MHEDAVDETGRESEPLTRPLAFTTLVTLCLSVFIPTHALDDAMFMADAYLWGSGFDLRSSRLDDLLFFLQPAGLALTVAACLWCLKNNGSRALLTSVAGLALLLVLAGVRSFAVDGARWWHMGTAFYVVLLVVCAVLLVAAVTVHRGATASVHVTGS